MLSTTVEIEQLNESFERAQTFLECSGCSNARTTLNWVSKRLSIFTQYHNGA